MAQNKASLEKVMQSTLKNKKAGSEVATAIVGIEGMIASGIDETSIVENSDARVLGRCRATLCHKAYGKRLADAMSTVDSIIAAEAIVIEPIDKVIVPSTNKQKLRKICTDEFARKDVGVAVSDMVSKAELAIDELIAIYGTGGAKEIVSVNEIQHIAFDAVPDAGNFKLVFSAQTTADIAFGAVAADVKAALEALSNIDLVNVTGNFTAGFDVEFAGSLAATDAAQMTSTGNTLEASAVPVVITITTPTPGVAGNEAVATSLEAIKAILES